MCCLSDDEELYNISEGEGCKCGPKCMWALLWLTFAVACLGVAMGGYNFHRDHKQDDAIEASQDVAATKVLSVEINEQYYGVNTLTLAGTPYVDHIPAGLIMTKGGSMYGKGHCITRKHDPMASLYFIKQFEADFRGPLVNDSYDYIEMRFEIPFGTLLDQHSGTGYYGYNIGLEYDEEYDRESNRPIRTRCALPYCPRSTTDEAVESLTHYSNIVKEHYVSQGTLSLKNATNFSYAMPTHITCGCTDETPARFACKFSAKELIGTYGRYRLDINFDYLIRPALRGPTNPY